MKPNFKNLSRSLIAIALASPLSAGADQGGILLQALPAGIVYPGFINSVPNNPSALAAEKDVSQLQGLYSPAMFGSVDNTFGASLAVGKGNFGIGGGVSRSQYSASAAASYNSTTYYPTSTLGTATTNWNVGGAFRHKKISLGVAALSTSTTTDGSTYYYTPTGSTTVTSPASYLFGFRYGADKGMSTGIVVKDTAGVSTQASIGVGFMDPENYNFEVDLHLPPFSNLTDGAVYGATMAAAVYLGKQVGFSYSALIQTVIGTATVNTDTTATTPTTGTSSTLTSGLAVTHTAAVMYRPFRKNYLTGQYSSIGQASLGFNMVF